MAGKDEELRAKLRGKPERELAESIAYDTALALVSHIEEECDTLGEIEAVLDKVYKILAIRYPKIIRG